MPQADQSSKIGTSTSTNVNRVIQNSKNQQQPVNVPGIQQTGQYNRQFVDVPGAGK